MRKRTLSPGFAFVNGISHLLGDNPSAKKFLESEYLFNLGFISVDNTGVQSREIDFLNAISKLVPVGCNKPMIRIGKTRDGGYLVPDDLLSIDACFSPGVGGVHHFEDHLAKEFSIPSFMCDDTQDPSKLTLDKSMQFFVPKRLASASLDNLITLDDWILSSSFSESEDLLLQMDIEGSEYHCLMATSDSVFSKFRIMVLEFHAISLLQTSRFTNTLFNPVLSKILRNFDCVHAHPNNSSGYFRYYADSLQQELVIPQCIELTFYRKTCNQFKTPPLIPHPLDLDNSDKYPTLPLGYPWTHRIYK